MNLAAVDLDDAADLDDPPDLDSVDLDSVDLDSFDDLDDAEEDLQAALAGDLDEPDIADVAAADELGDPDELAAEADELAAADEFARADEFAGAGELAEDADALEGGSRPDQPAAVGSLGVVTVAPDGTEDE